MNNFHFLPTFSPSYLNEYLVCSQYSGSNRKLKISSTKRLNGFSQQLSIHGITVCQRLPKLKKGCFQRYSSIVIL